MLGERDMVFPGRLRELGLLDGGMFGLLPDWGGAVLGYLGNAIVRERDVGNANHLREPGVRQRVVHGRLRAGRHAMRDGR